MYFRHRKIWYATMALICLTNYIAIGSKKFWHWRKERNSASQNVQANIQNQENVPQNNGFFNNSIYNTDVTSLRNIFLIIIVVMLLWIIRGVSLSLIDKTESNQVAMQFFVTNRLSNTMFMVVSPLALLLSKDEARQHIKFLFWNEWAPDFIQRFNPNRVHVIKQSHPKV